MRSFLRFAGLVLGFSLFAGPARADLAATGWWRTESDATGFCLLGTYAAETHDVFGTPVDFGTDVAQFFCTGATVDFVSSGHCEARPNPGALQFDFSVPFVPGDAGVYVPFVGSTSNVTGTAVDSLGVSSFVLDGEQARLPGGLPGTTIPGCSLVGPVGVAIGSGAVNAFRSVTTPSGTNVVVSATPNHLNTSTGEIDTPSVGIEFANVSTPGDTLVKATSSSADVIPFNFSVDDGGFDPVFLDISTTASFSGSITICQTYADEDDDGIVDTTGVPETALRFLHGEGGTFVDRTSSHDLAANRLCATVSSLSPFVIAVETTGSATHDSVVWSVRPVKAMLGDGSASTVKKVAIKVQNADLGDSTARPIRLRVDHGSCPPGVLVDEASQPIQPDFDSKTSGAQDTISLAGGKSKSAALALQIRASDFATPSAASPTRCAIRFATHSGDASVIDPRPQNDETRLELEVIDRNDY